MAALFTATIFSGAFLLFLVQPLAAKMLLPYYGGAAAVWNACMVFFQVVLLLGYGYSHLLTSRLGFRQQAAVHLAILLLPLWVLPTIFDETAIPPPGADPVFWLLRTLLLKVGPPFFVIASISPLLQKWFSRSNHPRAYDPYFLYSSSNAGSIFALLGYPLLFELLWGAGELSAIWRWGYIALAVLVAACLAATWRIRPGRETRAAAEFGVEDHAAFVPVSLKSGVFWVFAALVPSALMLGVTNHITTNIATFPLLWVLPLCLYLLTFVIVFARKQIVSHQYVIKVLPFLILPLAPTLFVSSMLESVLIPFHLLLFLLSPRPATVSSP